jgi:hypothetical protein
MLVRRVFEAVSTVLKDTNPQFRRWTERELVNWANDGQLVISNFLPQAATRTDVIKLRAGTYQRIDRIATTDILPDDGVAITSEVRGRQVYSVLCNMGTNGTTPGRSLRVVSAEAMSAHNPDASDAQHFHVSPPAKAGTWIRLMYLAEPVTIPYPNTPGDYAVAGTSMQGIGIQDAYGPDLINYIIARALLKDAEGGIAPLAQAYTNLFLGSISTQMEAITGNNPNLSVLPLAPMPAAQAS